MNGAWGDLRERNEDEPPPGKPGVRDDERARAHDPAAREKEVDVENPGAPAKAVAAPDGPLHVPDEPQERRRREPAADGQDLVVEPRLGPDIHGLGPIDRGPAQDAGSGSREKNAGAAQGPSPIAQIGSERQIIDHPPMIEDFPARRNPAPARLISLRPCIRM